MAGNDTIDPYPLIPAEAEEILVVRKDIFEKIRAQYQAFFQGLRGRLAQRSSNTRATRGRFSKPKAPLPQKTHFSAYEPSPAIVFNECDYRRWCRVTEWFNQFGPDAEKYQRNILDQIKMDT